MLGRACLALLLVGLIGCSSNDPPPGDAGRDSATSDSGSDATPPDGGSDAAIDSGTDAGGDDATVDSGADADTSCGDATCMESEYCEYGGDCGAGGGGVCMERPRICTEDCPGVCGCDGRIYCNECIAASMGMDIDPEGDCMSPGCDAFDARGEGACEAILGWSWNGTACVALSGCSCAGADCGRLYGGPDLCMRAHSECLPTDCEAMDARGEGLCDAFFGYAWNGSMCVGLSGCSCVGADCGSTYTSIDACNAAYSECRPTACGGFIGATCSDTEWCDYEAGGAPCGFADGGGTCQPRPEACIALFDPVCGCDGRTYSNECVAQQNGQDIQSRGECAAPPPPPPA